MTEFDTATQVTEACFWWSPRPHPKGRDPQRPRNFLEPLPMPK